MTRLNTLDKMLLLSSLGIGVAHGFCDAQGIQMAPGLHNGATYGPAMLSAGYLGIGSVMRGLVVHRDGAAARRGAVNGVILGGVVSGTATLAGYFAGYAVGYVTK